MNSIQCNESEIMQMEEKMKNWIQSQQKHLNEYSFQSKVLDSSLREWVMNQSKLINEFQSISSSLEKLVKMNQADNYKEERIQSMEISQLEETIQEKRENMERDEKEKGKEKEKIDNDKNNDNNNNNNNNNNNINKKKEKKKEKKEFRFEDYSQRRIAFQMIYLGWKYKGLVTQKDTEETIENYLFNALEKMKLIKNRDECKYSRSGRTDKGVSATGQVIALNIRSSIRETIGTVSVGLRFQSKNENQKEMKEELEMDWIRMINQNLPPEIRLISYCPVHTDFDARFNTSHRIYKYFFLKRNLNLHKMRESAQKLIGEHDFRNFCKIDVVNVDHFMRRIYTFDIDLFEGDAEKEESVYCITIRGSAFLWHQVRCMVSILFLIGQQLEEPSLIDSLLDIDSNPNKPNYLMASEIPLVLWKCEYEDLEWNLPPSTTLSAIIAHFKEIKSDFIIKNSITSLVLSHLRSFGVEMDSDQSKKRAHHTPILERDRQDSFEEKRQQMSGSKKIRFEKKKEKAARKE